MRRLTIPEKHQLRIARDTLRMSPVMAAVMGGPSHDEARAIIADLTRPETAEYGSHDVTPAERESWRHETEAP